MSRRHRKEGTAKREGGSKGDPYSDRNRTTKVGFNKHGLLRYSGEFDNEASRLGVSKHIFVKPKEYQKALLVDQVDID